MNSIMRVCFFESLSKNFCFRREGMLLYSYILLLKGYHFMNEEVQVERNIQKTKLLRIVYFENSLLGNVLGTLWMRYMSPSKKVDILTAIREENWQIR